jgi:hypothetical protein
MRTSTLVCHGRWALVLALVLPACANRGMEAPEPDGTGGSLGTGGSGSGGVPGTGGAGRGGTTGTGGTLSTGGSPGTGGKAGGTGTGGTVSTGGTPGTGGTPATGGTPGTGGTPATGGTPGTGGVAGSAGGQPGTGGQAGSSATGGTPGTGGVAGGGGAAGAGTGGAAGGGGAAATGGSGGHGGASGSGGAAACVVTSSALDCTSAGALPLTPDGLVTDFSNWSSTAMAWCDADGLTGSIFSYGGSATGTTYAALVDTTAANFKMNFTVPANGYAGAGILFNSCVNASGFNALSFTATMPSGSLNGCSLLVQLATQDQRPSNSTNPSGGTCNPTGTCYQHPAVTLTTVPGTTTKTVYTQLFTAFSNPSMSTIATRTQVIGVQWQVNGTGAGCTVELHADDVKFVTQ